MNDFEKYVIELTRKGAVDQVAFLKKLDRMVRPSQRKKIQQNDKSVLKELVFPSWLKWDLLYLWAMNRAETDGKQACVFCSEVTQGGTNFKGKFICHDCYNDFKTVQGLANNRIES